MPISIPQSREPTPRELDVLRLLAEGYTDNEIGKRLHLSHHTVKAHRRRIGMKLGQRKRAGMVVEAMRRGWIR